MGRKLSKVIGQTIIATFDYINEGSIFIIASFVFINVTCIYKNISFVYSLYRTEATLLPMKGKFSLNRKEVFY